MTEPAIAIVARIEEELGPMVANHQEYESLFKAIRSGEHAYDIVPSVLPRMIRQESWMRRYDRNSGKPYLLDANEFIRFIEEKPSLGLGTTLNNIRRYLGEGNPQRAAFEEAVDKGRGNPIGRKNAPREQNGEFSSNPNIVRVTGDVTQPTVSLPLVSDQQKRDRSREPQAGNSYGYAVRRLNTAAENEPERYAPIRDRLVSGAISANKAMIEAEFRNPTFAITTDPVAASRLIIKHFPRESLLTLLGELANWAGYDIVERTS